MRCWFISLLTWVNYRGVKNGGALNNMVTGAKIGGMIILIIAGFLYAGPADKEVSVSVSTSYPGFFTVLSAFFGALLSALWAYDGWANITYISGEIKNPQRNVPLAIMAGVGIAMFLYILLNIVYMRVLPLSVLASMDENKIAAAEVAGMIMGPLGTLIITFLIMISALGALNACIIVYPRFTTVWRKKVHSTGKLHMYIRVSEHPIFLCCFPLPGAVYWLLPALSTC